ncbi:unnamed protein product [Pneumocystis jirovecii]|uniref:RRM domain-containing protein n=1 Tax=Pneumocystis jirovecii TaxID=42068 RepID=L0P973_PNEJI|nr:unnamed protein product [Pneumocystis jirovecii]
MEKHNEGVQAQGMGGMGGIRIHRNDISQSRLFNGYSVAAENENLPLLRSFSSPTLRPAELGKNSFGALASTSASSVESSAASAVSITQPAMPSPDVLFSKHTPTTYATVHAGGRVERTNASRLGYRVYEDSFLQTSSATASAFHPPSTQQTISSFSYDPSVVTPMTYNNYGYMARRTVFKPREKQPNQWLNESETIPTGSVQNSNINNTFVPSGVPASISDSQENSLQDNSFQEPTMNTLKTTNRAEDGVIPSAIVVKNIPFQIKKEQLLELFDTLDIPKPYAFNYHFDNGNFRGLAFANFYTPEETTRVILSLNGHDIMGRKLRVEYKRVLPVGDRERPSREKKEKRTQYDEQNNSNNPGYTKGKGKFKGDIDLNDEATLKIYSRLLLFRNDQSPNAPNEFIFPPDLNPQQRRIVHLVAEKLDLEHTSCGENDAKYIVVKRLNANNIDNMNKNFWNKSDFGVPGQSANFVPSLLTTNSATLGMTSTTHDFFGNSYTDFRVWPTKTFNDIRNINTQIPSKTYLHKQMQPHNTLLNTSFESGLPATRNDLGAMMQDLNLNVTNKQLKNTEWETKKGFRNMAIKTNTD